jgi:hypothetical protein
VGFVTLWNFEQSFLARTRDPDSRLPILVSINHYFSYFIVIVRLFPSEGTRIWLVRVVSLS